jgi:hypothetical protein
MKPEYKLTTLTFIVIVIAIVCLDFIINHAIILLLPIIIVLGVLSCLVVYKNIFKQTEESKYFYVGAMIFAIGICGFLSMLKADVVNTTICQTFLTGTVSTYPVEVDYESDTQEGTYTEDRLYFKANTPQQERAVKYLLDIQPLVIQISFLSAFFAWFQINYKPKEYGQRNH